MPIGLKRRGRRKHCADHRADKYRKVPPRQAACLPAATHFAIAAKQASRGRSWCCAGSDPAGFDRRSARESEQQAAGGSCGKIGKVWLTALYRSGKNRSHFAPGGCLERRCCVLGRGSKVFRQAETFVKFLKTNGLILR